MASCALLGDLGTRIRAGDITVPVTKPSPTTQLPVRYAVTVEAFLTRWRDQRSYPAVAGVVLDPEPAGETLLKAVPTRPANYCETDVPGASSHQSDTAGW